MMKKIGYIFLVLIMLVNLSACGSKRAKSKDSNVGMWKAVSASMMGVTQDIKDVLEKGASLELKENGKFNMVLDGKKVSGKWLYKDGKLTLSEKKREYGGTIEEGVLTLNKMLGIGLDLTFEKEGGSVGGRRLKAKGDAGYYVIEKAIESGETVTAEEFEEMGMFAYILLNEDGTFVSSFGEDDVDTGTWEKGVLNFQNAQGEIEDSINYKLSGDKMTIDWGGDFIVTYVRSKDAPPVTTSGKTDDAQELSELREWWDGEWYGYWQTYSATGDYKGLEDNLWECYALIEMNLDSTGAIYLWDDGGDIARVDISVSKDSSSGHMGKAISVSGDQWEGAEIGYGDWEIDPSLHAYEDYFVIDSHYKDELGGGFDYKVYLRPWGKIWDDVAEDDRPQWDDDWYFDNADDSMFKAIRGYGGYIHSQLPETPETGESSEKPESPEKEKPSAVSNGAPIEVSEEMEGIMIAGTLPAEGWVPEKNPFGFNLFNVATVDSVYSNSPRIQINIKKELKDFDFYKDDFENFKVIENRTIGGIDMKGRTYQNIGMDWIEYTGMIDDGHAVSVKISKIDITTGEGNTVLNSIKFK